MFGLSDLVLSVFAIPALIVLIDLMAQLKSSVARRHCYSVTATTARSADYTLIVPIYGNIRYLENAEYLSQYGRRVLLVTSSGESPVFYEALSAIADRYGFRVHVSPKPDHATDGKPRRQIGGTLRDTIVRSAHSAISSKYVVCIDADTVTKVSIDYLVGAVEAANLDVASVRLTIANPETLLGRLQAHEYAMAMRMRRIMPWLLSGGCHVLRREVHLDLMLRHSLFFQGNDVELGLLAKARGYKVGHVAFDVPTTVPANLRSWVNQRKAWGGGEFRLMVVNVHMSIKHPWLYLYGALIVILLLPLRWYYLLHPTWPLLAALGFYSLALIAINWRRRDWALLVYPFYSLVYTLLMVPIGIVTYFRMAIKHRNFGIIRPNRKVPVGDLFLPNEVPSPVVLSALGRLAMLARGRHRKTGLQEPAASPLLIVSEDAVVDISDRDLVGGYRG
jgi:cellulose synthase/poly-beta-1,6-N-acetylglucosamine synthase-like glycosyltransferase